MLGTFRAKVSRGGTNPTKEIVFNVSSLAHLNIIGRTTICDLQVDVLSLLKGSNSTTSNTGTNVIRKDDQPKLELRKACQEPGYLKGFKPEMAFKPVATPAHLAHGKQATKVTNSQQGKREHPVQGYKVGALCYARYFGPRHTRQPR